MYVAPVVTRARLSPDDFVDAALRLAERDGFEALTLRSLGIHLGVDSTAVYRHFESKDALLLAVLDRLLTEASDEQVMPTTPRGRLESMARVMRTVLLRHPALAPALAGMETTTGGSLRVTDRAIAALAELGLEGTELLDHYQALESYTVGATAFDLLGAPHQWRVRARRYRQAADPVVRDAGRTEDSVAATSERAFELGLRILLDGCEAAGARRRQT